MSNLAITWLGQAVFLYRFPKGLLVCVDPYLSYAASGGKTRERLLPILIPPSRINADLVITTHDHTDHFDEHSLRPLAERSETLFLGPCSCREHWLGMGMPGERFLRLDRGESLEVAGARLTAVRAEHTSGSKEDAIGVIIAADGLRVYQVGDSEYSEPLLESVRGMQPDLLAVPINGRLGNMNAQQAALLTQAVQPKAVIPMHYSMFRHNNADPQEFVDACRALGVSTRIVVMKPGKPVELELI